MRVIIVINLFVGLLSGIILFAADTASATEDTVIEAEIAALIDHGGYVLEHDGRLLAARNSTASLVPASILKIATGLAALQILGPDYRFETNFYYDAEKNLTIEGFGDPFLVSEGVTSVLERLKGLGVEEINDLHLNDGAFKLDVLADGSANSANPYDTANGALVVNFNTVNIDVGPDGTISSAEPQTPTLPLMAVVGRELPVGKHRCSITAGATTDFQEITSRYVGELFRGLQQKQGIRGNGAILRQRLPVGGTPLYVHRSGLTLEEMLGPLLRYSNNFIANQLFLVCGVKRYGYPATWEKARAALREFMQRELQLSGSEISMVEGAGLSPHNRVTPAAMRVILNAFKPYAGHLPVHGGRLVKSGTLTGVYAYAGYFTQKGRQDSFVVILNQERNTRDRVLDLMELLPVR